jgi:HEAT repeat protein
MRVRTAIVGGLLLIVLAGISAALWMTLGSAPESVADAPASTPTEHVDSDATDESGAARRHVGAEGEEQDTPADAAAPDGPVTKAQRLQWIREWLEIACGNGYAWNDRMKAQKAILEFDEAESIPIILALASDPDPEAPGWGWAMSLLGNLGPRAKAAVPGLVKLLRRDEDRGSAAAYALGRIGAPAIDALLECLTADDRDVQMRVFTALGMIDDPPRRVTEAVIGFLGHADAEMRAQAAGTLYRSGGAPEIVVPALIGALGDSSGDVRFQAAIALYVQGPDAAAAAPALGNVLRDENGSVGLYAASTLGRIGAPAASETDKLVALLTEAPGEWKGAIPQALAGIGTEALLTALKSPNPRARALAIPLVREAVDADPSTAPAAVAALDGELGSEDADVRNEAARTLGALGNRAASTVDALLKLADDANGRVRRSALIAAVQVGGARERVLDVLVRELRDGPRNSRAAAAEALGALGPDGAPAVDALGAAVNDPDLVVREHAARALESIGPAAITAASTLAGRLSDDSERVRLAAAIALTAVDPPGLVARDTIGKLRISDSPEIRKGLIQGLGRHPNAVWLAVVVNRVDDRHAEVRLAAAIALAEYTAHSPTVVPAIIARLEKDRSAGVQIALMDTLGKHGKDAAPAAPLLERYVTSSRSLQAVREKAREVLPKLR